MVCFVLNVRWPGTGWVLFCGSRATALIFANPAVCRLLCEAGTFSESVWSEVTSPELDLLSVTTTSQRLSARPCWILQSPSSPIQSWNILSLRSAANLDTRIRTFLHLIDYQVWRYERHSLRNDSEFDAKRFMILITITSLHIFLFFYSLWPHKKTVNC